MQQTGPGAHRTPACLAFADYVNRFVAGDGAPSSPKRAKMLTRVNPALDGPVILFQEVTRGTAPVDVGRSPPEHPRL